MPCTATTAINGLIASVGVLCSKRKSWRDIGGTYDAQMAFVVVDPSSRDGHHLCRMWRAAIAGATNEHTDSSTNHYTTTNHGTNRSADV